MKTSQTLGIFVIIILLGILYYMITSPIQEAPIEVECIVDGDCIPKESLVGVQYYCEEGICKTKPLGNPADMFCEEESGIVEMKIDPRPGDGQYSVCILSNGTECDAWAYYNGGCDTCVTYCLKQPHIMCVGTWNITGEYPNCTCELDCTAECVEDTDCPQPRCIGMKSVCMDGTCVTIDEVTGLATRCI